VEFAAKKLDTKPKIDYFATSLPNLLLFDEDLGKRNRIESVLMSALAHHGLGKVEAAARQLEEVMAIDPNNLFAAEMLAWVKPEAAAEVKVEVGNKG